jgi:hypothetical protein
MDADGKRSFKVHIFQIGDELPQKKTKIVSKYDQLQKHILNDLNIEPNT